MFFLKDMLILYFSKVFDMRMCENFMYNLNIPMRRKIRSIEVNGCGVKTNGVVKGNAELMFNGEFFFQ